MKAVSDFTKKKYVIKSWFQIKHEVAVEQHYSILHFFNDTQDILDIIFFALLL